MRWNRAEWINTGIILIVILSALLFAERAQSTLQLPSPMMQARAECLAAVLGKHPPAAWSKIATEHARDRRICELAVNLYHGLQMIGGPRWRERLMLSEKAVR